MIRVAHYYDNDDMNKFRTRIKLLYIVDFARLIYADASPAQPERFRRDEEGGGAGLFLISLWLMMGF